MPRQLSEHRAPGQRRREMRCCGALFRRHATRRRCSPPPLLPGVRPPASHRHALTRHAEASADVANTPEQQHARSAHACRPIFTAKDAERTNTNIADTRAAVRYIDIKSMKIFERHYDTLSRDQTPRHRTTPPSFSQRQFTALQPRLIHPFAAHATQSTRCHAGIRGCS